MRKKILQEHINITYFNVQASGTMLLSTSLHYNFRKYDLYTTFIQTFIEEMFVGSLLWMRYQIIQKTKEYRSTVNKFLSL